jgi:outer membrane protein TolC
MLYKMHRSIIMLLSLLIVGQEMFAQSTPPKAKPLHQPATVNTSPDLPDTAIENRLVALAMQGPEYDASVHQNKITELDLKRTKSSWLNFLALSTTYNDQSFAKQQTVPGATNTIVYPKYYFGITIPLGIIFSQGNQVRSAREAVALGKDQQEQLARTLKVAVLTKYRQYKSFNTLIEMESELINDVLAIAAQAEESFKKGGISIESYIASQRARNDEMAKNLNLKLQQDLVKLEIEKIIGIPLEGVLHGR